MMTGRKGISTLKKSVSQCIILSCVGGGIQFSFSPSSIFQTGPLTLCGDNERYSPPVVMFLDYDENTHGSPVLLVGVDEITPRSQFLAHFSFTRFSDTMTGLRIRGGNRVPNTGRERYNE
jgi:hypothetical protein